MSMYFGLELIGKKVLWSVFRFRYDLYLAILHTWV